MLRKYLKNTSFSSYEDFSRNCKIQVPRNFNFAYDVVDEWAKKEPNKTALVWCNDHGEERTFTFAEVKQYSDRTANFLTSLGIRKGDPVMMILKRHYEFWFTLIALHKIGAVGVPATHMLTKKDIVYRNNAADIRMIIATDDKELIARVDEAQKESPSLKFKAVVGKSTYEGWYDFHTEVEQSSDNFLRPTGKAAPASTDKLLLYFTSGTTGMPKMVVHDYTYPLGHIMTAHFWQQVQENGLHLTVADTGWAKAVWGKIYGQWICGCGVMVYDMDKFIPQNLLKVIEKYGVTSFCVPPTMYRYIIKEDLSKYNFKKLKHCTVAGEPLNPEVYSQFLKATGLKLIEGFGQTEAVVMVATYPGLEPKPGSMGKPTPLYDIDIIDDKGASCGVGEEGQIVIRTGKNKPLGLFSGYYRDKALTTKVWHDGIYYTGDIAYRDEDGYLWFVGRADDCFKSSGYRIGPFEVESALLEHPAVVECAVTGVPDPDRGQVVKATVVLAKNYKPGNALVKELQDHVKRVTAPYKYPRIIEFVTELPKTISGKIRRVEIRDTDKKK
jgi:acetyl-CoA synthetase